MVRTPIIFEDKDKYLILKDTGRSLLKIHRLLLEFKLGRKLKPNEVTHHINEDKQDNRLENLEVREKGKHQRQHQIKKGLLSEKQICPKCKGKKGYVAKLCFKCYHKNRGNK